MFYLIDNWQYFLLPIIILLSFIPASLIIYFLFVFIFKIIIKRTKRALYDFIIKHLKNPLKFFFPLLIVNLFLPITGLNRLVSEWFNVLQNIFSVLLIVTIAWMLIKVAYILEDYVKYKFSIDNKENLSARKINTQIQFIKRIIIIVIFIISISIILMRFKEIRYIGTTILTSAGVAGLIIGFSAQKFLTNLFAGFQIAFAQPIRIDDVVIVENESGRIEEITLTYVVVRIWDKKKLILPINYFIEKPFQNLTRASSEILGTVFIYTDYTIPVDEVRNRLDEICKASKNWNGKVCILQVTDSKENSLELRALVSADDSSKCWDLRCEVREELVKFIQKNYEDKLPHIRAILKN